MEEISRKFLETVMQLYEYRKNKYTVDRRNKEEFLKFLVKVYAECTQKKEFFEIIEEYKIRYIYNESKVEEDITPEEQLGIGIVYDYINDFDFEKDYFNIFTTSLIIHNKLYSMCLGSEFGGNLREATALLFDTDIEVVDAEEAKKEFNTYISRTNDIMKDLENLDINKYIEKVVILTADLIKLQPFGDGNKRTFRSLLNLLLKKVNLPPVYIDNSKKNEYKDALLKAMKDNNYEDLIQFYYDRIYESILQLDLNIETKDLNIKQKLK